MLHEMAGLMFVVCVPTSNYERTLLANTLPKIVSLTSEELKIEYESNFKTFESKSESKKMSVIEEEVKSKFEKQSSEASLEFSSGFEIPNIVITVDQENKIESSLPKINRKKSPTDPTKELDQEGELSMEKVLKKVLKKLNIENSVWCRGEDDQYNQVFFSVESSDRCEEILQYLNDMGIGIKYNSVVSVIPCTLYYHGKDMTQIPDNTESVESKKEGKFSMKTSAWEKFVQSVRARLTVAQVVEGVKGNANLTFDFVSRLLISSFVSAVGLVEDSTVILVASMLMSPLMGPIMAGTFGTVIRDRSLQKIGVLNELFGLFVCVTVGFVFGLVVAVTNNHWGNTAWPTGLMLLRGRVRSLWIGLLVSIPSGVSIAIAVLGNHFSSMVGVAISVSILPSAVNAGLCWALSLVEFIWRGHIQLESLDGDPTVRTYTPIYSETPAAELAILGAVSLCLTLMNIVCIFVIGTLILKVKEVAPRNPKDEEQFWKHDIKIARDYNRTFSEQDGDELQMRLAEELAREEIENDLQGMSPELYRGFGRHRSLIKKEEVSPKLYSRFGRHRSFIKPEAVSPSLYNRFGRHRSFIKPEELLKPEILGYQNQLTWSPCTTSVRPQNRTTMKDIEDLYTAFTGREPKVNIVPEQWTVSESQKEEQTITEHQDPWAVKNEYKTESESHKESGGDRGRFTITPVSKLA